MTTTRDRFQGQILGAGSTSGIRVVIGRWVDSPLGAFADAMVETSDGHRVLMAPSRQVAQFVSATYVFDETRLEEVGADVRGDRWRVDSTSLTLELTIGARLPLGRLLRLVPRPLATHPAWATAVDPFARVVLRGVRTRGVARGGRREWYGATDLHAVISLRGAFDGIPFGGLTDVDPPCRFGFSSTPRTPSVTDVVTTVRHNGA